MKKTLLILAALAPCAFAEQFWVGGVNENGGWVDQDKDRNAEYNEYRYNEATYGWDKVTPGTGNSGYFNNDRNSGDGFMCWAASATDILTWWHQQNPGAQAQNPAAPHEQGEIWELFKSNFYNDSGSADAGIQWYMKGIQPEWEPYPRPENTIEGYYPSLTLESSYYDIRSFDSAWESPWDYNWDAGTTKESVCLEMAKKITSLISDGYIISLGISGSEGGKHATTLWGVETDDAGYLTKMWITDSDDKLNGYGTGLIELTCAPVENDVVIVEGYDPIGKLAAYGIQSPNHVYEEEEFKDAKAGRMWYDYTSDGRMDYFYDFSAIKMPLVANPDVPEPATGTLGLLALAGLAARRRRK